MTAWSVSLIPLSSPFLFSEHHQSLSCTFQTRDGSMWTFLYWFLSFVSLVSCRGFLTHFHSLQSPRQSLLIPRTIFLFYSFSHASSTPWTLDLLRALQRLSWIIFSSFSAWSAWVSPQEFTRLTIAPHLYIQVLRLAADYLHPDPPWFFLLPWFQAHCSSRLCPRTFCSPASAESHQFMLHHSFPFLNFL